MQVLKSQRGIYTVVGKGVSCHFVSGLKSLHFRTA